MNTNPVILHLAQFYPIAVTIIKPAILLFIILTIFLVRPNLGGSTKEQMKGILLCILLGVGTVLTTVGALPPLLAVISAQNMQPEWYITFLFTFIGGGLLYVWSDNKLRELPTESTEYTIQLFKSCIALLGTVAIALSIVSLAVASMYNQLAVRGVWAMPVVLLMYGGLLQYLVRDQKKSRKEHGAIKTIRKILIARK
jgi:uncharacterized membrane protein